VEDRRGDVRRARGRGRRARPPLPTTHGDSEMSAESISCSPRR
jgi:hypothetical protein